MSTYINEAFNLAYEKKKFDFRRAYNDAFTLAQKKEGQVKLATEIQKYLQRQFDGYNFVKLEDFVQQWEKEDWHIKVINNVTLMFQEAFVPASKGQFQSATMIGKKVQSDKFKEIETQFVSQLLDMIIAEQNNVSCSVRSSNGPIDKRLIDKSLEIIREMTRMDNFNKQLKSMTLTWLSEWFTTQMTKGVGVSELLSLSNALVEHVQECSQQYSLEKIISPVLSTAICVPVVAHTIGWIVSFLDGDRFSDLSNFYKLAELIDNDTAITTLGKQLKAHVEASIKDVSDIPQIITRHKKYEKILQCLNEKMKTFVFHGFQQSLTERFAETLSMYIDSLFAKKLSEKEFEDCVSDCIQLALYIKDRDLFFMYYTKLATRRLLLGKNVEQERVVLSIIKTYFGFSSTHTLEIMYKDIQSAKEINDEFHEVEKSSPLYVSVVTSGIWDIKNVAVVPQALVPFVDSFTKFYKSRFSNRNLKFMTLGEVEVKFGKYVLKATLPQTNVLLAMNTCAEHTIATLTSTTGLTSDLVTSVVQSLANPKVPVLKKNGENIVVNPLFTSKTIMVKVAPVLKKETPVEQKETLQKLDRDREIKLNAAIVRIMKARKQLDLNAIVIAVTEALKQYFSPTAAAIKKSMEFLIEEEYIHRMENNMKMFEYVA